MSLWEFLERIETDPFDTELTELFLGRHQEAENRKENDHDNRNA